MMRDLDVVSYSHRGRAARTPSGHPHDDGVQIKTWCEGRPHGISPERRASKGRALLVAPLARHRIDAPPTPGVSLSTRNTCGQWGDGWQHGASFCHSLAREGVTKLPKRRQAGLISEPSRSPEAEVLGHVRLLACPGLPGPGPHGPLRVNFWVVNAPDRRAGCWDPVAGSAMMLP